MSQVSVWSLALVFVISFVQVCHSCTGGGARRSVNKGAQNDGASSTGADGGLGGDAEMGEWKGGSDGNGEYMRNANAVECDFERDCNWRNGGGNEDELEWSGVSGRPDAKRWELITGEDERPRGDFMIAASESRGSKDDSALLISDPIACQTGTSTLSVKHWRSESNPKAKLEACYRLVGDDELLDCQTAGRGVGPHDMIFEPIDQPFEYVLRASNFDDDNFGSFVAVDEIKFDGEIESDRSSCGGGAADTTSPPQSDNAQPSARQGANSNGGNNGANGGGGSGTGNEQATCEALSCDFSRGPCNWNLKGDGAAESGASKGWQLTTGKANKVNPLTGVKRDPSGRRDTQFAVSNFKSSTRKSDSETAKLKRTVYSLSSDRVKLDKTQFLAFDLYHATEGAELAICKDAQGRDCFYQSADVPKREWVRVVTPMPAGEYAVHALARYDQSKRSNIGQIAIANIEVHNSRSATSSSKIC